MSDPAEQQPVDQAAELEAATAQAIEACNGDLLATVKALIVANGLLEQELAEIYAKASHGFLRGRRVAEAQGLIVRYGLRRGAHSGTSTTRSGMNPAAFSKTPPPREYPRGLQTMRVVPSPTT